MKCSNAKIYTNRNNIFMNTLGLTATMRKFIIPHTLKTPLHLCAMLNTTLKLSLSFPKPDSVNIACRVPP